MQWAGQAVVEVPGGPDHGPLHCDVVGERKETRRTRSEVIILTKKPVRGVGLVELLHELGFLTFVE